MTSYALLLDDTLTKSQRADIEMIRTNIEMETKMIDDLLDHARHRERQSNAAAGAG